MFQENKMKTFCFKKHLGKSQEKNDSYIYMASNPKEFQAICRFFNVINLQSIYVTYV